MSTTASDRNFQAQFPENPYYGSGSYRRHIRLSQQAGAVLAELEDDCHGFRVHLQHDGRQVTAITAETLRIPYNTCASATEPLQAMVGVTLGSEPKTVIAQVNPFSNCTHLFDLTVLAIAHAVRSEPERLYAVEVTDEKDGQPADARVWLNGEEMLHLKTFQWQIIAPRELSDKPLFKGFAAWASEYFSGDLREAAFVLQKGYFVSSARRHDAKAMEGMRGDDTPYIPGACHTYTEGRVQQAVRLPNSRRDFTDTPEQLLKFK
ncbi:DUF2889 domain-containing protein [Litorivivens sp.]|uniref:DUF2889 domain-containing protein n=1 Tax=Litorivivens sp. TaxID=2020868 RepID=UPI003566EB4A